MLEWLERLASRVKGHEPPEPRPSGDPFAGVRHPRPRGPYGRAAAEAVPEPEPEEGVQVTASPRR